MIKQSKSNASIENNVQGSSNAGNKIANQTQKLNLNGLAASTTANIIAAAKPSTTETTTLTIKLNPVEESKSDGQRTSTEESKGVNSDNDLVLSTTRTSQTNMTMAQNNNSSVSEVFKQRLVNYRRQISKNMVFSDQLELRDPQMVAELATEVYKNMRTIETKLKVDANYLTKVQNPSEVKDTSRAFLIEWIIDVHRKFRLLPETLYVTVFILDRFLSLQSIKKSQLHILGVTSLLISTKYEEIYPPDLKDLLTVSENKFTKAEVLKMEQQILITLQFDLTSPSSYRFLERYRKLSTIVGNEEKVFYFAQYI